MSTITEINTDVWSCPRCYRTNFTPDADEHCYYGCGYSIGDHMVKSFGWKCPKCLSKNESQLFMPQYACNHCHNQIENLRDIILIP